MEWSSVLSGVSVGTVLAAAFFLYRLINHRACRSTCCGRTASASLDIGASPYASTSAVPLHQTLSSGSNDLNPTISLRPTTHSVRSAPNALVKLESSGADDSLTIGIGPVASAEADATLSAPDSPESAGVLAGSNVVHTALHTQ